MTFPGLQALPQLLVERLLNTAVEGLFIAGLVWLLLRVFGRQNSGTRFAIWFAALLSIVAIPFLGASASVNAHSMALPAPSLYRGITLSSTWAFYLFLAWGVCTGVLLLRLSVGLWRLARLRRNCSDVDTSSLDPAIAKIMRDFGNSRRVKLCMSDEISLPAAIGFLQPAIVFPTQLLEQLSVDETKVILLHELAHLRRWDDWTNLVQKIVKAVFFFHPAVSWIENRLTLEREKACDDTVLAQTASPKIYASSLISFAEKLHHARSVALAQALVSRMHQMSQRVKHILDAQRPSRTGLSKPALGASAGMLALLFAAAPYAPRVVAFQTPVSEQSMQHVHGVQAMSGNPTAMSTKIEARASQVSNLPQQARAIPASFVQRTVPVHRKLVSTSPRKAVAMRASAGQPEARQIAPTPNAVPLRATFVIFETTQYDGFGPQIWTLCVWKVATENQNKEFQSEIFVSVI